MKSLSLLGTTALALVLSQVTPSALYAETPAALAGQVTSDAEGALSAFAAHLGWQIVRLDIADPDNCLAVFKSDRDAGLILFAALLLDAALPRFA